MNFLNFFTCKLQTEINMKLLQISKNVKFIYSEKAAKFFEISAGDLSYVVPVKYTVEISQNFVAFSEYMNFILVSATTISENLFSSHWKSENLGSNFSWLQFFPKTCKNIVIIFALVSKIKSSQKIYRISLNNVLPYIMSSLE